MTQEVLLATAVIVIAAYFGGELAVRLSQPRVIGEIAAGIVLGPSVLGALWPEATAQLFPPEVIPLLKPIADLGLVLFMFVVGLELSIDHLRGQGHRAVVISHVSIIVPMALGGLLGWAIYDTVGGQASRTEFALFVGAAVAVTAFPVLARILHETGLHATRIGALVIACAAVDDVTAWCILALVLAFAADAGSGSAAVTILATLAFGLGMWFVVRPLLARLREVPVVAAVGLALAAAWATEAIGVHAIFGAFLAGAVIPRRPDEAPLIAHRLESVVSVVLLPVFFLLVGLSTRIGLLDSPARWGVLAAVLVVAMAGKLGGASVAARLVGEGWRDALTIGVLMNTRGLTEIVILAVGLEARVISPAMFTIMVIMALVTTAMAVPALRWVTGDRSIGRTSSRSRARSTR